MWLDKEYKKDHRKGFMRLVLSYKWIPLCFRRRASWDGNLLYFSGFDPEELKKKKILGSDMNDPVKLRRLQEVLADPERKRQAEIVRDDILKLDKIRKLLDSLSIFGVKCLQHRVEDELERRVNTDAYMWGSARGVGLETHNPDRFEAYFGKRVEPDGKFFGPHFIQNL